MWDVGGGQEHVALWAFAGPLGTQGYRALTLAGAELGMSRLRQNPICPGGGAAGTQVAEAQETREALCLGGMSGEGA